MPSQMGKLHQDWCISYTQHQYFHYFLQLLLPLQKLYHFLGSADQLNHLQHLDLYGNGLELEDLNQRVEVFMDYFH